MKNILSILFISLSVTLFSQSMVTFQVDMDSYAGTFTTVSVGGTWNGFNSTDFPMTETPVGSGVYMTTVSLPDGAYEYKFIEDGGIAGEEYYETLPGGSSCTINTSGFDNRELNVAGNATLPLVCFESCTACGVVGPMVDITYMVNMSSQATDPSGVFIAGGGNFGNPGDTPLTDDGTGADAVAGDDIWSVTVTKPEGFSSFYIFTNGNCPDYSCKENLAGQPCGDPANFNDRFLPSVQNDTLVLVCFGQCTTDGSCGVLPDPGNITLSVDMNQYTGIEVLTANNVYVSGTFNGFDGLANPMDDSDGDGVYDVTVTMPGGLQEYKFQINGWADQEEFFGGEPCTIPNGPFTNRGINVDGDASVSTVCFSSCTACSTTGCQAPTGLSVSENNFGGSNPTVNASWTNTEGTTDCEVRGGRISGTSAGTANPEFANINNTQVVTQTNGSMVNFNIALYNNPNIPFTIGQTYGYQVRCQCSDGSGYSDWSGPTPSSTFIVPSPPAGMDVSQGIEAKSISAGISEMNIFPNPANDILNIQVVLETEGNVQVFLVNTMGQKVAEEIISNDTVGTELNISNLSEGVYFVTLVTDMGSITERIMVK